MTTAPTAPTPETTALLDAICNPTPLSKTALPTEEVMGQLLLLGHTGNHIREIPPWRKPRPYAIGGIGQGVTYTFDADLGVVIPWLSAGKHEFVYVSAWHATRLLNMARARIAALEADDEYARQKGADRPLLAPQLWLRDLVREFVWVYGYDDSLPPSVRDSIFPNLSKYMDGLIKADISDRLPVFNPDGISSVPGDGGAAWSRNHDRNHGRASQVAMWDAVDAKASE